MFFLLKPYFREVMSIDGKPSTVNLPYSPQKAQTLTEHPKYLFPLTTSINGTQTVTLTPGSIILSLTPTDTEGDPTSQYSATPV